MQLWHPVLPTSSHSKESSFPSQPGWGRAPPFSRPGNRESRCQAHGPMSPSELHSGGARALTRSLTWTPCSSHHPRAGSEGPKSRLGGGLSRSHKHGLLSHGGAGSAGRQPAADETTAFLPGTQGLLRPRLQPELGISDAAAGRPGLGQPSGLGRAPGQQSSLAWGSGLQAFLPDPPHGHVSRSPVIKAGGRALNLAPLRQSQAVGLEEMGLSSPLLPFPGTGTCSDPLAVSEEGDRKLRVVF